MIRNILLFLLLSLGTEVVADQTFEQNTAKDTLYYYGVTYQLEIIETGVPTDFYMSELDLVSNTWTPISNTFGWGNFDESILVDYTPTKVYAGGRLGIHTSIRNQHNFSTDPVDSTDFPIDVVYSSATFNSIENIWYNDLFYLEWASNTNTLPERVNLEYKLQSSSTWTLIGEVDVVSGAISVHNKFSKEDVNFRLTYDSTDYTIAETGFIEFLEPSMTITNKNQVENFIFKDGDNIVIEFETERISEYSQIEVYINGEFAENIPYNSATYTYTSNAEVNEMVSIEFYSEGYQIEDIILISEYKWFEVAPIGSEYRLGDNIYFSWAYSNQFQYVDVFIKKNSDEEYIRLNNNWSIGNVYSYVVRSLDSTLTFKFVTTDGYTELVEETNLVDIVDFCKEDSLLIVIDDLENTIDSLSNLEPEIIEILTILIKDTPSGVETESDHYVSDMNILNTDGTVLYIADYTKYSHIYISGYNGLVVYEGNGNIITDYVDISQLSSGVYFVVLITFDNDIQVFKFNKF